MSDLVVSRARFQFDLQLFAGEKTEQATPRRRQEARRRGQVFRSVELTSALLLLAGLIGARYLGPRIYGELAGAFREFLTAFPARDLTPGDVRALGNQVTLILARTAGPLIGGAAAVGLMANVAQVGFLLTAEPLAFRLDRLDPAQGLARMFSKRALVELGKALVKVAAVGYVTYLAIRSEYTKLPGLIDMELAEAARYTGDLVWRVGLRAGIVLLVLAGFDYLYQRWEYEQGLRMSREEVKQEFKETEGDPKVRGRMREKQRQISMRRMMAEVPKADVVITNPTHLAVAVAYRPGEMEAPRVVAKGQEYMAERIKEVAREHGVTIMENVPLAQALYKSVEIGELIPPGLYQAVAEVLAFVYRLKGKV